MTRTATATGTIGIEIAAIVYHAVLAVQDELAYLRTVRALRSASDIALADLGLTRDMIKPAARKVVFGR